MKREIICQTCEPKLRKLFNIEPHKTTSTPYPNEHVKMIGGSAMFSYVCDHCNAPIRQREFCFAVSIWNDRHPNDHFPWERDYIMPGVMT